MRSLAHSDYLAMRRFDGLDGIRAIAAVMVVFFHYGGPDRLQGWIGVQIFFVLSGYLITTLMLREESRTGKVSLRAFYLRRVFRILPVYFVVLAIITASTLIAGIFMSSNLGPEMWKYLTFFNEFAGGTPYGHSWSLGVEQKFYLLWPLVAFTFGAPTLARRLGTTGLLIAAAVVATPFTIAPLASGWPAHYVSILLGCAVALLMHHKNSYRFVQPLTHPAVAVGVTLAVVVLHYFLKPLGDLLNTKAGIPGFVWVLAFYPLAIAIMLPAVIAPGPVAKILSCRPMAYIGERSYSLYLVQSIAAAIIIYGLGLNLTGNWLAVAVTALSLVLAAVLYRTVEVPMINLGRRVIAGKPKAQPEDARPAPTPVS